MVIDNGFLLGGMFLSIFALGIIGLLLIEKLTHTKPNKMMQLRNKIKRNRIR